jgi:hypothetical protein
MESYLDLYEPSPLHSPSFSPTKSLKEPDSEESPPKQPTKQSRFNLNLFANQIEEKRVPKNYERVQTHSTSRPTDLEKLETSARKKLFEEPKSAYIQRSQSREIPGRSNLVPINNELIRDKEIEHLNHKIRNLIKEKNDLRNKLENQNSIIKKLEMKRNNGFGSNKSSLTNANIDPALLEVTFKPNIDFEYQIQKIKKFPREIFRLPKSKVIN